MSGPCDQLIFGASDAFHSDSTGGELNLGLSPVQSVSTFPYFPAQLEQENKQFFLLKSVCCFFFFIAFHVSLLV